MLLEKEDGTTSTTTTTTATEEIVYMNLGGLGLSATTMMFVVFTVIAVLMLIHVFVRRFLGRDGDGDEGGFRLGLISRLGMGDKAASKGYVPLKGNI